MMGGEVGRSELPVFVWRVGGGPMATIRDASAADRGAVRALYADAFPDEDLSALVLALMDDPGTALSLVAEAGGVTIGHIAFSTCRIGPEGRPVALLGPLAVAPARQRRGVGSALVREGLGRLRGRPHHAVFVLGDPTYYARFGFAPQDHVAAPYPLPEAWRAAWQALSLSDEALPEGVLHVSPPWRDAAYWSDP